MLSLGRWSGLRRVESNRSTRSQTSNREQEATGVKKSLGKEVNESRKYCLENRKNDEEHYLLNRAIMGMGPPELHNMADSHVPATLPNALQACSQ